MKDNLVSSVNFKGKGAYLLTIWKLLTTKVTSNLLAILLNIISMPEMVSAILSFYFISFYLLVLLLIRPCIYLFFE